MDVMLPAMSAVKVLAPSQKIADPEKNRLKEKYDNLLVLKEYSSVYRIEL